MKRKSIVDVIPVRAFLVLMLSLVVFSIVALACNNEPEQQPVNQACQLARVLMLPSPECYPRTTNIGWFPDTCYCQLATLTPPDSNGKTTRVPMQVIWISSPVNAPAEVKSVYQIPPPTPAQPPHPQLRKE